MNIFVLDKDPKKAAEYHCDKHVVKMILEHAQMMSTACRVSGLDVGYKQTHLNHPCNIWLRQSLNNYLWLYELTFHLNEEYKRRYNHQHNHKSFDVIESLPLPDLPMVPMTPFTKAMQSLPDVYNIEDPVEAYRQYYIKYKRDFCTWKNTPTPYWFK